MKLVPDGWVYTYTGPPFSKWNPSWSARCRICDTKYDHTEDEAVALLAAHVRTAHNDGPEPVGMVPPADPGQPEHIDGSVVSSGEGGH